MACEIGGIKKEIIETAPQKGSEIDNLTISIQRMKEQTKWQPAWMLADGIRQTLSEMDQETK